MSRKSRPKKTMFVITSMPVGGAETLLVNMLRQFDPARIEPAVCCLKHKDELGEEICKEFPVFSDLIGHKFDVSVMGRLKRLFREQNADAVITVGAGDKMFWGRLAARYAGVPVILSALHSTGWPDGVGHLNRLLTRITTGFIAVADSHGQYLVQQEGFPASKVFVVPNGIDTGRFQFDPQARHRWREEWGLSPDSPVVGIVAALRPEKNHELFVRAAEHVLQQMPHAHFVIVGDGPMRSAIETQIADRNLQHAIHLVGCTHDIPGVLSMVDMFALTSHMEASPVSILEAMSCERPVVATDVGSINESVLQGQTGYRVPEGDVDAMVERWVEILSDAPARMVMGEKARQHVVENSSLVSMTEGYSTLVESLFARSMGDDIGNPDRWGELQVAHASTSAIS